MTLMAFAWTYEKPKYGRDDVEYEKWYSASMRSAALRLTKDEINKALGRADKDMHRATASHLAAIQATGSMQSQSQRRAQSGNVVESCSYQTRALRGALEIYDLFPEHTKEFRERAACAANDNAACASDQTAGTGEALSHG